MQFSIKQQMKYCPSNSEAIQNLPIESHTPHACRSCKGIFDMDKKVGSAEAICGFQQPYARMSELVFFSMVLPSYGSQS
ncbi:hypothetical protein Pint_26457 [Pistacia integerrima]|uniref:Uncharacterized protein n=1 Tax=Pistacia integerrima TaxID=434235 RepID=A0ACC0YCW0_9ROSI|nr:hypothetical protein Pint_26457 [Pistacia integerrima]